MAIFLKNFIRNLSTFKINKIRHFSNHSQILNKFYHQEKVNSRLHEPVLLNEVLKHIVDDTPQFKTYIDMTFGAGGHSEAILIKNPNSKIIAFDRDPVAFELALELADKFPDRVTPLIGQFSNVSQLLKQNSIDENSIDAVLIDAGCSSMQFDTAERGFSISKDGPLDMRMNSRLGPDSVTAADLVNKLDEQSLSKIIWRYGEERMHKKIAHGIVFFRSVHGKIETTKQLADIVATTIGNTRLDSLNRQTSSATKTFQALRIFVNNELNELYNGITQIHKFLKPEGRLAVISFHSLEDRIVKNHFNNVDIKTLEKDTSDTKNKKNYSDMKFELNKNLNLDMESFNNTIRRPWTQLNKKVITPTKHEVEINPRARSAKLRIALKNVVD